METEELTVDPKRNDLDLITKEHYKKQMGAVKIILNFKKKGLTAREIAMKVQLAEYYIEMVIFRGEEGMDKYWADMYKMKKHDK